MKRYLVALTAVLLLQCSAMAGYSLTWSPTSGVVGVGGTITVDLFLNETTTTNINDFGAQNASILVTSSFGTMGLPVANDTGIGFDPAFTTVANPTASSASIEEASLLGAGIGGGNSLKLGTFTITSAVVGSGTLTVAGVNGTADDLTINTDLIGGVDQIGSPAFFAGAPVFNFTFAAVPEPTSFIAASGMGLFGAWVARRRKAKKQAAAA